MTSMKQQNGVDDAISNRHRRQSTSKTSNRQADDAGHRLGIIETYAVMQAAVSIIILSIITHFWADGIDSPSAFLILLLFQLLILSVALILLASGNDAWFSFVFAQLVLFMGIAELTTSAFVVLRDTRFERCRDFGCTIVRGSVFLRNRFIYTSALCGFFHTIIGVVYLILGPHCHDTPEPTIIISKSLLIRLRNKISNTDRGGSTLHTISRQPELKFITVDKPSCATTASSAKIRICSETGESLPYIVRTLERVKDIEYVDDSTTSPTHSLRKTIAQPEEPVPLCAERLNSSLKESTENDETVALTETCNYTNRTQPDVKETKAQL